MSESPSPESPDEEILEAEIVDDKPSAGRKCGTIFGRVLLVALLGVLVIELHGKFGYERTLTTLRANASKVVGEQIAGDRPDLEEWTLPLAEAEKCVSGFPSKSRRMLFGSPVVVLRWFSLFKTYVIQLPLDDDNVVTSLSTDDVDL